MPESSPSDLLVVGSVAIDNVTTPFGKAAEALGGSATYFSYAASFFTQARIVAAVGDDFPREHLQLLEKRGVDIAGLEVRPAPACDEFGDRDLSRSAIGRPDDANAAQRAGQRNHGPGRQGHADVAADGRRIPDLERREK